jgi:hypothetical protein
MAEFLRNDVDNEIGVKRETTEIKITYAKPQHDKYAQEVLERSDKGYEEILSLIHDSKKDIDRSEYKI